MSRQPGSVPPTVASNEANWLKYVEPPEELADTGRCHSVVPNGNPQNTKGQDNISNEQYQQQQALLLAQVQATLHALQNCPQQPVSTNQRGQLASVVSPVAAVSQRPPELSHFGIAYRKPDEPQPVMNAQQSIFINGKDAHMLPAAGISSAATNSASAQLQLQQSSDFLQQMQVPDMSKCMISTTHDRETGVTMQPFPVPQQAFMQNLCGEPFSNQPGPSASRRLLPAYFQDSGRPFVTSTAVPNVTMDKMQLEQNQFLVHGPNVRCNQSAWSGNNPRQSPYSQYCGTSSTSAEQYNVVGRLTPVMVGPAGDLFCSSIPSQICTIPSSAMVGSKFPR